MESIVSETSTGEDVETELTDIVWALMEKSGFLSGLKSRVLEFVELNGKVDDITVFPERANAKILERIFEYLDWVGMKRTCLALAAESPVTFDLKKCSTEGPLLNKLLCLDGENIGGKNCSEKLPLDVPLNDSYEVPIIPVTVPLPTVPPPEPKNEDLSVSTDGLMSISEFESNIEANTEEDSLDSKCNGLSSAEHVIKISHQQKVDNISANSYKDPSSTSTPCLNPQPFVSKDDYEKGNSSKMDPDVSDLSSISELVSSLEPNTEEVSLQSHCNGMSSAEHVIKLGKENLISMNNSHTEEPESDVKTASN